MTKEDIDLLFKDICARLPYEVKGIVEDGIKVTTPFEWPVEKSIEFSMRYMVIKNGWRPYLFPMSSMTEEQKREFDISMDMGYAAAYNSEINCANRMIDFFNKNHLDYRGLILKGLAIDATGLNIY